MLDNAHHRTGLNREVLQQFQGTDIPAASSVSSDVFRVSPALSAPSSGAVSRTQREIWHPISINDSRQRYDANKTNPEVLEFWRRPTSIISENNESQFTRKVFSYQLRGDPRYQQVLPGTSLGPDDTTLPGQGPMVNAGGCARPAVTSDWVPNDDGRFPILSIPSGFTEIGEIFVTRGGETKVCGFTFLHTNWAITSLHCIAKKKGGSALVDVLPANGSLASAVFLVPDLKKRQDNVLECLSTPTKPGCPGKLISVIDIHVADKTWVQDLPTHDIALLKLAPATADGRTHVPPNFKKTIPASVTVAGFGASNVSTHKAGFGLLVGWHNGGTIIQDRLYTWNRADNPVGTMQCMGDSGSAIYDGQFFGRPNENRSLFAITSFVTLPTNQAKAHDKRSGQKCLDAAISTSAVIVASYKDWICKVAPEIEGC